MQGSTFAFNSYARYTAELLVRENTWALVIGGNSFRCSDYDKNITEITGSDIIKSRNDGILAIKLSRVYFDDMKISHNDNGLIVNDSFYNKIINLTISNEVAYLLIDRKYLTIEFDQSKLHGK